ncbi:MAG: hypothetical protein HQL32_09200 [Planctomycetes bacterium]|nr:hypothetical protein [Planctomycetota bacterium]
MDGYKVDDMPQYFTMRELDASNPYMQLIIWDGKKYIDIKAMTNKRLFGAKIEDFVPSKA